MRIAFTTTVGEQDWDENVGGWRCPAIRIPGAAIEAVYVSGARVDTGWFEVMTDLAIIRWARPDHPDRATISIILTKELSTEELTARWRKLAIALPAIATIAAATITGLISHSNTKSEPSAAAPISAPQATTPNLLPTDFRILMPRGLRVVVTWKGMPEADADKALRDAGISLASVDEGTRLAYAALARRIPDEIIYYPWIVDGKPANLGYSHAITRPGPADNSRFGEFQLFQQDTFFSIIFHKTHDGEPQGPVLGLKDLDIDWQRVREGLSKALKALYREQKTVEFGELGVFSDPDGRWEYRLEYRIVEKK